MPQNRNYIRAEIKIYLAIGNHIQRIYENLSPKCYLTHTTETIDNFTIHYIYPENNFLIACFDSNIPEEVIRKIALMKPLRAVSRDGSFKDSPGKLNIDGIFKTLSPNTTVRVI